MANVVSSLKGKERFSASKYIRGSTDLNIIRDVKDLTNTVNGGFNTFNRNIRKIKDIAVPNTLTTIVNEGKAMIEDPFK